MKVSQKYKEIFKLKKMLEDAKIPFDFYERDTEISAIIPEWEHWHINYPSKKGCIISAIEGTGTYGAEDDKLEIMGGLTEEEAKHDTVEGWLTAEDVFNRIKKFEERRIRIVKKVIRYVDEDTLEIKELIVEDETTESESEIFELFEQALGCETEEFTKKYLAMKQAEKEFEEVYTPFKENLIELHSKCSDLPKTVVVGPTKLTYVSPSTRNSIDSKKLKEEEPAIAEKYTKTTNVKATIRLEEI